MSSCRPTKVQLHDLSFLRFDAAGENTVEEDSALERQGGILNNSVCTSSTTNL